MPEDKKEKEFKTQGGMLSGADIRSRIICREQVDDYLKLFEQRKWTEIGNETWKQVNGNDTNGPSWDKRLVITDYHEVNVTPFSYDLSLGDQVFSIQKPSVPIVLEKGKPYVMERGETVVVITEELVAIPHAYSATIWPRFNMVRQGVFQSMVKIDPTWYGKLAVAISNLSPATVELKRGEAFATLLLYELSEPSDVDLWTLKDLQAITDIAVKENIPTEFEGEINKINDHIFSRELRGYCWVKDQSLAARGIKRDQVEVLKECFADEKWYDFVDRLTKKWLEKKYDKTKKRMIVMNALGMKDLWSIVSGLSEKGYIRKEDVLRQPLDEDSLVEAAVRYGKPFEVVARIPDTIVKRIEDETIPKMEVEIESKIQMRVIILVFSLFGFISLVLTIFVMLFRLGGKEFLEKFSNWPGLYATMTTIGGIFGLAILLLAYTWLTKLKQGREREERKLEEQRGEIERREKEMKKREDKLDEKFREWESKQAEKMKDFDKSIKKQLSESKSKKYE